MYSAIFTPGKIGPLYLKNRIIMAPLGSRLTTENGAVTQEMVNFYKRRAEGGAAAVVTEAMGVDYPLGVGKANHVRICDDCFMPGLARLAEGIHEGGAKAFAMLWHTGINRGFMWNEMPVGPSSVFNPNTGLIPRTLSVDEIKDIEVKFGQAAHRAMVCGFDGVVVHAGHGYLVSSFVSSVTNIRTDEYGGSFENRIRFALEIIRQIRAATRPDFPILVRINGSDFQEGGITVEEAAAFAQALEAEGVAAVDVSAGVYSTIDHMIEPVQYEEGWKIYLAEEIKKHVSIPVIGVGVLLTPEKVNSCLEEGRIDFAAMGRELLCEPDWPRKVQAGDTHIVHCIGCNTCFARISDNVPIRCSVSPAAGREYAQPVPVAEGQKKHIAVAGAGPAGITAAVTAAVRGHDVDLYEKEDHIGGQLILAATPPGKARIFDFVDYLKEELARSSVKVHLSTPFTLKAAEDGAFDAIIVAAGASCRVINVDGCPQDDIASAWDVIRGDIDVSGKDVAVIGAGSVGCETGLYLHAHGAGSVSLIEVRAKAGQDLDNMTRFKVMDELAEAGAEQYLECQARSYDAETKTLHVDGKDGSCDLHCDLIVSAVGSVSNTGLAEELYEAGCPVQTVGDCAVVGKIYDAVGRGYEAGLSV